MSQSFDESQLRICGNPFLWVPYLWKLIYNHGQRRLKKKFSVMRFNLDYSTPTYAGSILRPLCAVIFFCWKYLIWNILKRMYRNTFLIKKILVRTICQILFGSSRTFCRLFFIFKTETVIFLTKFHISYLDLMLTSLNILLAYINFITMTYIYIFIQNMIYNISPSSVVL